MNSANQQHVIFNLKSDSVVREYGYARMFNSARGAKTARAAIVRKSNGKLTAADLVVCTYAEFEEQFDPLVETHNMLNPNASPIMIRKSLKGTASDPGTERYHTC